MLKSENFFIKPGYVCNEKALTYQEDGHIYWTDERIQASHKFQYHVYLLAAKIAKKHKYSRFMDVGSGPATKAKKIIAPLVNEAVFLDQPDCEPLVHKFYPEAHFVAANLEVCDVDLAFSSDLLVCADVLEHLYNPLPCLKFSYNHLAPSGIALFSTPERDILRGPDCVVSPHPAHVREWNRDEFRKLLEYSGFNVIDQVLLPAAKMPFFEDAIWKINKSIGLIGRTHWSSCQVAICSKK